MTMLYVHNDHLEAHMQTQHGVDPESEDEEDPVRRAKDDRRNATKKTDRLAARLEKHKTGAVDAIKAYWADKPYYTTRDEFLELCKVDVLTEQRSEDIREQWVKRRGPDVAPQTCIACTPPSS